MEYNIQTVYWNDIEGAGRGEYNEAFLANLREQLKKTETAGTQSIYIDPRFYSGKADFWACAEKRDAVLFEDFTEAMLHTARRIKDCVAVAGFVFPDFDTDWAVLCTDDKDRRKYGDFFKQAFATKHKNYDFVQRKLPH